MFFHRWGPDEADSYSPTTSSVYNHIISMNQKNLLFLAPPKSVQTPLQISLTKYRPNKTTSSLYPWPWCCVFHFPPLCQSQAICLSLMLVNYWHSHRVSPLLIRYVSVPPLFDTQSIICYGRPFLYVSSSRWPSDHATFAVRSVLLPLCYVSHFWTGLPCEHPCSTRPSMEYKTFKGWSMLKEPLTG